MNEISQDTTMIKHLAPCRIMNTQLYIKEIIVYKEFDSGMRSCYLIIFCKITVYICQLIK